MKVWMKDKRYKIKKDGKKYVVYRDNAVIAMTLSEEAAVNAVSVYSLNEAKLEEFEDWGDNEFYYPQKVENEK